MGSLHIGPADIDILKPVHIDWIADPHVIVTDKMDIIPDKTLVN